MGTVGSTARRKKMNLCELIEYLYGLLKRRQWAVCSVTKTDFSSADASLVETITQNMCLEDCIPLLFQADIDQYSVTEVSWQCALSSNHYITIRLVRIIL